MNKGITVLSLFDGMSCGRIALERAGIKVNNYFASEIDKHAIKVTQHNYPNTIQIGDATKVSYRGGVLYSENGNFEVGKIDLLIGGSPCQSFSNSGDGSGFNGKSGLFYEYVRLLNEVKPEYFLLENVKMKKEWEDVITFEMGVNPIEINTKHYLPQNRPRLYWTNLPHPNNRETVPYMLSDFLEQDVDESYFLTTEQLSKLDLNYKWSQNDIIRHKGGKHQQDNVYRYDGIMACLSASTHGAARHLTKTYLPDGSIRRLTETEVESLQGIPKNYTDCVSSSKRYEMVGNGWTIDVIVEFFRPLLNELHKL